LRFRYYLQLNDCWWVYQPSDTPFQIMNQDL